MQAKTFDDVFDTSSVLSIMLHGLALRDCNDMYRINTSLYNIMPQEYALYQYTTDWHTTSLPASKRPTAGKHWYQHVTSKNRFEMGENVWRRIFQKDDIAGAKDFFNCFRIYPTDQDSESFAEDHDWHANVIQLSHMTHVRSKGMLELVIAESGNEDSSFYSEDEAIYIYALADSVRRPTLIKIFGEIGITVADLALMIFCHRNPPGEQFIDMFQSSLTTDIDEDPVWTQLTSAHTLSRVELDPESLEYYLLKPFHTMAAGYHLEDENNVLSQFRHKFMDLDLIQRNEQVLSDDCERYQTVLEIVYATRPLNRALLTILNAKKHDTRYFHE